MCSGRRWRAEIQLDLKDGWAGNEILWSMDDTRMYGYIHNSTQEAEGLDICHLSTSLRLEFCSAHKIHEYLVLAANFLSFPVARERSQDQWMPLRLRAGGAGHPFL